MYLVRDVIISLWEKITMDAVKWIDAKNEPAIGGIYSEADFGFDLRDKLGEYLSDWELEGKPTLMDKMTFVNNTEDEVKDRNDEELEKLWKQYKRTVSSRITTGKKTKQKIYPLIYDEMRYSIERERAIVEPETNTTVTTTTITDQLESNMYEIDSTVISQDIDNTNTSRDDINKSPKRKHTVDHVNTKKLKKDIDPFAFVLSSLQNPKPRPIESNVAHVAEQPNPFDMVFSRILGNK